MPIEEHAKQILQAKNIKKGGLVSINFENRTERAVQFNLCDWQFTTGDSNALGHVYKRTELDVGYTAIGCQYTHTIQKAISN